MGEESQQEPPLLHEVDRVFCVLLQVAQSMKQLDIAVFVLSTKQQRHDVVKVVVGAENFAAASAFAFLGKNQFLNNSR
jgi:hypothetical protein